eukprot:6481-Pleurochrysis_carterae.AAC.4
MDTLPPLATRGNTRTACTHACTQSHAQTHASAYALLLLSRTHTHPRAHKSSRPPIRPLFSHALAHTLVHTNTGTGTDARAHAVTRTNASAHAYNRSHMLASTQCSHMHTSAPALKSDFPFSLLQERVESSSEEDEISEVEISDGALLRAAVLPEGMWRAATAGREAEAALSFISSRLSALLASS